MALIWPLGRADRPRSAAGRSKSRPDRVYDGPAGRWSLPGAKGIRERLGVSGWRFGEARRSCGYASCPRVLLSSCPPTFQVGLTVPGRPGSAFGNEVRHIIATRDEARPHALSADQRDAGPYLQTCFLILSLALTLALVAAMPRRALSAPRASVRLRSRRGSPCRRR